MPHYICWTKHGVKGIVKVENKQEEEGDHDIPKWVVDIIIGDGDVDDQANEDDHTDAS